MMPIELYTDGSCLKGPNFSGNGAGGYGFIIRYWDEPQDAEAVPVERLIEGSQGYRLTTSNRMEIMAAIYGLRMVLQKFDEGVFTGQNQIQLFSDSEYFCNAINNNWIDRWQSNNWMTAPFHSKPAAPVKNRDLWEMVVQVRDQIRSRNLILSVAHVKGHNGNEFNEKADRLAVGASTGTNHIIDEVYEKTMTTRRG